MTADLTESTPAQRRLTFTAAADYYPPGDPRRTVAFDAGWTGEVGETYGEAVFDDACADWALAAGVARLDPESVPGDAGDAAPGA